MSEVEAERCPQCPTSGPPSRSREDAKVDPEDELYWIACTKCETWYHSTCLVQGSLEYRSTIPEPALKVLDDYEGVWTNWTAWVDKWYCRSCLDFSTSSENPRPPRHPFKATLKSGCPPKSHPVKKSRQSSIITDDSPGPSKRPRLSSSQQPDENGTTRPKRKAAENAPDYHAWNHGIPTPTGNWLKLIQEPEKYGADIRIGDFPQVPGNMLTKEWLESDLSTFDGPVSPLTFYGLERRPMVIRPENGGIEAMGGKLPDRSLTVADVAEHVGRNHPVDVIDVASQTSAQWNLGKWAEYFKASSAPEWSGKVYNIISLEITGTPLAKKVTPPQIVREIDWVDNYWHFEAGGRKKAQPQAQTNTSNVGGESIGDAKVAQVGQEWVQDKTKPGAKWPKVQLYCLMGIKGSWTDWHVDFAASSVYYSIHTGSKEFYFIRPTDHNLKMYTQWSGDAELQQSKWLGDMCDGGVEKIRLEAGDTMIIPAGYIHAVYTPVNTIVFGGNFIHSYSIPTQLHLRQIEIDTKVPQRFRFPFLERLCWYVADKHCVYLRTLRSYRPANTKAQPILTKPPHLVVIKGLLVLVDFLQGQINILEDEVSEDKKKKMVHDRIPGDVVKDPAGLVRELKWRLERELPLEERPTGIHDKAVGKTETTPAPQASAKDVKPKKRTMEDKIAPRGSRLSGFRMRPWNPATSYPSEITESTDNLPRPTADGVPGSVQPVEVRSEVFRQVTKRQYALVDGKTVVEEREVVLTERRFTWGEELSGESSLDVKPGDIVAAALEMASEGPGGAVGDIKME